MALQCFNPHSNCPPPLRWMIVWSAVLQPLISVIITTCFAENYKMHPADNPLLPNQNKKRPLGVLWAILRKAAKPLIESAFALLPIILVIAFFQLIVLRQPIPNMGQMLWGSLLVLTGLALFVQGLQMALFPLGEEMAYNFVRKGNLWWLLVFAFALGFGTTVAEPALIAISQEAARIAASGRLIHDSAEALNNYAIGLRLTVALAVGVALVLGVFRILKGWPVQYLIIGGYFAVVIMTYFAPPEIIGIAYDSGGVTTSTVTVPLVAALGIGLAKTIHGRDPLIDGFGLIAFASLTPMIFVMAYGMLF